MTRLERWGPDEPALDDIERRILGVTIELATEGGYEAVRQRDVAARAGVALATVYARFRSKDVLLAAALELDNRRWMDELREMPLRGRTPLSRVVRLFENLTDTWLRRPELVRASLRAATSGDHEAMQRLIVAQQRLNRVIVDVLRGSGKRAALAPEPAQAVATVLVMVWFANLTAWAAGVMERPVMIDFMRQSADMLLHGAAPPSGRAGRASGA